MPVRFVVRKGNNYLGIELLLQRKRPSLNLYECNAKGVEVRIIPLAYFLSAKEAKIMQDFLNSLEGAPQP